MKTKKVCGESMEVYSRIVGYYRPVQNWNKGKREEFGIRKTFKMDKQSVKENVREVPGEEKSIFAI